MYIVHMGPENIPEHPKRFNMRLQLGMFGAGIEFIVFLVVTFFNFSWVGNLTRKIEREGRKLLINITSNLILFAFFLLIEYFIFQLIFQDGRPRFVFNYYIVLNLSIFILAVTIANFLILYRKNKISEIENIKLREEKTKAELTALKEQISPHFFFNTLSTLSSIIRHEHKDEGLEFIQDMSSTYRYALSSGRKDLVELREELDFLESYIALMRKRFGEKLNIKIDLGDDFLFSQIPPMCLQVLVENAIQHNIITQIKPLKIEIYMQSGMIHVRNNLQEKEQAEGFGLGLQNLNNRFKLLLNKDIFIEKTKTHFMVKIPLT